MSMEKEHLISEPKSKYIRREKIAIKTLDNLDNEILKKFNYLSQNRY